MKKIIFLVLTIMTFFSSCEMMQYEMRDDFYAEKASDHELYYNSDFEVIQTLDDISFFVMVSVKYQTEKGDDWSNPEDVYLRGYGDCDDITLLANNIAKVMFDIEYDICLLDQSVITKHVIEGGDADHMMPYLDGSVFESLYKMTVPLNAKISYLYYFDEVFTKSSPSYTEYKSTKIYDSYEETWAKALDPNSPSLRLGPDREWVIINQ